MSENLKDINDILAHYVKINLITDDQAQELISLLNNKEDYLAKVSELEKEGFTSLAIDLRNFIGVNSEDQPINPIDFSKLKPKSFTAKVSERPSLVPSGTLDVKVKPIPKKNLVTEFMKINNELLDYFRMEIASESSLSKVYELKAKLDEIFSELSKPDHNTELGLVTSFYNTIAHGIILFEDKFSNTRKLKPAV